MTGARPLVSVIVPVFQGERFLEASLRSVLDDEYRPLELIVVDDGSTDGSMGIAARFPEVRLIGQPNRGPSAARNVGIAASTGEMLTFLDHDDLLPPGSLSLRVEYLRARPQVGCVLGNQRSFVESGATAPGWASAGGAAGADRFVPLAAMMVRRGALQVAGGFDESFRISEDAEWLFRARARGVVIEMIPDVVLLRRFHGANASYSTAAIQAGFLRALRGRVAERRAGSPDEDR